MKKFTKTAICTLLIISFTTPATVFAGAGTMGFFGGITEGLRMPTVTARVLNPALNARRSIAGTYEYSEMIFLDGVPELFTGQLTVTQGAGVTDAPNGTFTVTNAVVPNAQSPEDIDIFRTIVYTVQWRREGNQIIKNYDATAWTEQISIGDTDFFLDPDQSFFVISIIEDHNPGIMFYRGLLSKRAVYFIDDTDQTVVVEATGHIYGFDSPYSSTETQSLDVWVMADDWQMSYQIRPSVSVTTSMMYQPTMPTAISFVGNYMHLMSNQSVAAYDIFIVPQPFYWQPTSGSFNIQTHTTHEMLPATDLSIWHGHFAHQDMSRLFAQQILTGQANHFVPNQAMTRGEFTQAIVRALRIEIQPIVPLGPFNRTQRIVFPDVIQERPEYAYILAGHNVGLVYGRVDGNFHIDVPISREEAVATLIRSLGLENVVPNPTPITAFADSLQISSWANREIAAALELGIIAPDINGNFRPLDLITKAEAAALINRFIDYMREDLVRDYSERMVNFVW